MLSAGCGRQAAQGGLVSLVQTLGFIIVMNKCCVGQFKVCDDDSSAGAQNVSAKINPIQLEMHRRQN